VDSYRKTSIVATLGPAVDSDEAVEELLKAGLNVARFNFSHGDHAEHRGRAERLRAASKRLGIPVALLLDTKGPEIRTGRLKDDAKVELENGARFSITTREVEGDASLVSISYKKLPGEVSAGTHIYIADGVIDIEVESVEGDTVHGVVRSGGTLGSRKNVNIPGVRVDLPAITEKDTGDILFAVEHDFDFIAASFIRKPEDVTRIKDLLLENDSEIKVISKIEDQQGLENIDEIIRVSDGIMVARGDLGVQLSTEKIPLAQKRIIDKCNRQNKPVITATQMLDSMIHNPTPTRAELTDVANAIFDGTDAVMLSGETAGGRYPTKAVETLTKIANAVESSVEYAERTRRYFEFHESTTDIGHAVAKSAYVLASEIGASAIIAPTLRGNSPQLLSKFRPRQMIIAVTVSPRVHRQLLLYWGIMPILAERVADSDLMIQNAIHLAMAHGYVKRLDRVITAAGIPLHSPIMMNTIKVHFLGNILARGHVGFGGSCSGRLVKAEDEDQARKKLQLDGSEILLAPVFFHGLMDVLNQIQGLVLEDQSQISHEEMQASNPDLVYLGDVPDAMAKLEDGLIVSLEGEEKLVYEGKITSTST
jgi:pyruvate kinase